MVTFDIVSKVATNAFDMPTIIDACEAYVEKKLDHPNVTIELIFTSPKEVEELNTKYRNKPKTTDVLSFPLWEHKRAITNKLVPVHLGSIIINGSKIIEQANIETVTPTELCQDLIIHSIDHLLGKHHPE